VDAPSAVARETDAQLNASVRASRTLDRGELSARAWFRREAIVLGGGWFTPGLRQIEEVAGAEAVASALWGRHGVTLTLQGGQESLAIPQAPGPSAGVFAAMASDEVMLKSGDLSVVPSFRVDRAGPFAGISPKLGGVLRLPAGFSVRANGGQAFRA